MNDQEQFEELDEEINLKIAELKELVSDVETNSNSTVARRKVERCLKEVDQQVRISTNDVLTF